MTIRTISSSRSNALVISSSIRSRLLASDPGFRRSVHIQHRDGSVLFFQNAFLLEWYDPETATPNDPNDDDMGAWLFVFAEHFPVMVFHKGDLSRWEQYEPVVVDMAEGSARREWPELD